MPSPQEFTRKISQRSEGSGRVKDRRREPNSRLGIEARKADAGAGSALPRLEESAGGAIADSLPIALRAYTEWIHDTESPSGTPKREVEKWPDFALLLDTETTIDSSHRLLFGGYRLFDLRSGKCFEEGLFYEDNLGATDPQGFACLEAYAKVEKSDGVTGRNQRIRLRSAREFLNKILWPMAQLGGLIVGFNLPFDLSRLAVGWSGGRRGFRDAFSPVLDLQR